MHSKIIIMLSLVFGGSYPTPPEMSTLKAVPYHEKIILYWDAAAETSIDSLTGYSDFAGYRLYRSDDGGETWGKSWQRIYDYSQNHVAWKPLGVFDLKEELDISHCIYKNTYFDDPYELCYSPVRSLKDYPKDVYEAIIDNFGTCAAKPTLYVYANPEPNPDSILVEYPPDLLDDNDLRTCDVSDVILEDYVNIWFGSVVRGDMHYIKIGSKTNIQDNSVIHVTTGISPTNIGSGVTIGHGAIIHGCTIKDNCMIGMGSTIMDDAKIDKGSLIGAGSLVPPKMQIPPRSLVVGVPGKIIRSVSDDEYEMILERSQEYIDLASHYN